MITRLLNLIRRLCFDRLLDIAAGWRLRLRHTVVPEDAKEDEKLQDALGTPFRIKLQFSAEGAFVPFEWSTEIDEGAVLKRTFEKEVVIKDDLGSGKLLTFDKRHVRYLPAGVDWPAILSDVSRGGL